MNRAIAQHLRPNRMRIVIVTKDPKPFEDTVATNAPSPISYNSPKPKELLEEDVVIQSYRIGVKPSDVTVVPADRVFE